MKQILQNLGNGETILAEVPAPARGRGAVLIQTTRSLVSLGTEKMLVDFGRGSYLAKARSQPDKVKQVLQKVRTDGLWTTVDAVRAKLDTPIPLGYCNVGRVLESDNDSVFRPGDRVISNGAHAEVVSIGENLIAKIPDEVTDETAAYAVVASIGLQGVRLAEPTLGERFVVSGLGLIGLLTVQILRAHGCEVMGIDFDQKKLKLAASMGAEVVDLSTGQDPVQAAQNWSNGVGIDGVIITASSKSNEIVHQSATMCRKRGRIVLVGVVGLDLQRADFYEKELSFRVSCSYGPGRYDDHYEKRGLDYPIGFVRWTEQRNFEAVLQLMRSGQIRTEQLTTHHFDFDHALEAYEAIHDKTALGILLEYQTGFDSAPTDQSIQVSADNSFQASDHVGIAFVGAGQFTTRMLLPLLPEQGHERVWITNRTGVSAAHAAKKHGFANCGTDYASAFTDDHVNAVFITTRHDQHGKLALEALNHGKHVFVEKPLAMTDEEIDAIEKKLHDTPSLRLMVGFNRRFSPHIQGIKKQLQAAPGPKSTIITVNAGAIPADHWTQDLEAGGGRIIGEACHFIDLARYLTGNPVEEISSATMSGGDGALGDCVAISMRFADGSIGTVHYLANGHKSFPKERIEVFASGKVFVVDNFRKSYGIGSRYRLKTRAQDKGHAQGLQQFLHNACVLGEWPIVRDELFEVSRLTLQTHRSVREQLARS